MIRIRDVARGRTDTRFSGEVPEGYWIKAGDLLIGMDGDFVCSRWRGPDALLNQRVCRVTPEKGAPVLLDFLAYALPAYLQLINDHTPSVTVKHLSSRTLHTIPLALPSMEEQVRLVSRIDTMFAEVAAGEDALAAAKASLGQWRQALLMAAVTGELTADWRAANPPAETGEALLQRILSDRRTRWAQDPRNKGKRYAEPPPADTTDLPALPEGWAWATLPQLGEFGRGKSKHRPRNDPRLYGGPYPFVQTGIVANSDGEITAYDQTYSELGLRQSKLWPEGTLCITIAANIAKTGVLNFAGCFPDSIVGVAPADGVNPRFLDLVIRTLQSGIEADAPATAQKNINLETLETIAIPLPPTAEQAEIVKSMATAKAESDAIMGLADARPGSALRQSILAAAFRGELAA